MVTINVKVQFRVKRNVVISYRRILSGNEVLYKLKSKFNDVAR